MRTFEVGVWEEQGGYLTVEAKNKAHAKRLAEEFITDYGFEMSTDSIPYIKGLRTTHRDTHLI